MELRAGEMLFLPAGWWHEVVSLNDEGGASHLAVNYWFHPPSAGGTALKPYADGFWQHVFDEQLKHT